MTKGDKVYLQATRVEGPESDEMQFEIVGNDDEHIRLAMSLRDFTRIITGEAHVPVKVSRYRGPQ